jgi:Ion channel
MGILLAFFGLALLILVTIDLLWTAFLEGVGPLSLRIGVTIGNTLHAIYRQTHSRRPLAWGGLLGTIAMIMTWTLMIWIGWTLIFCSWRGAVVSTGTTNPADAFDRFYFTGNTIFTLGVGDFVPQGHFFEILTDLCCGMGFFLFGAALSYLVPIISAATQKRQVAVCIWALGKNPLDIIFRAWDGKGTSALLPHFLSLSQLIALLGESHTTYPLLHGFRSTKRSASAGVNIAMLDEAITILECGLDRGCSLNLPTLGAMREVISEYLITVKPIFQYVHDDADPPLPSLEPLRELGIPVVDDETFDAAIAVMQERRRLLGKLATLEGWTWQDIWPEKIDLIATL